MIPSDIISKKRNGILLSKDEIKWFISSYLEDKVSDAQMASLLMAIYFQGLNKRELYAFTKTMINSGSTINFKNSDFFVADKHSTGGIGDKTSLILVPILASLNIKIPMIAGRSLAFTGGTIDKLESIPGFNTNQSLKSFKKITLENNSSIISQSNEICPADKKIYRLRDLTGTIPSLPLICSSIMSKKICEGINGLVLDVKIGNGAFLKTIDEGRKLAKLMKDMGDSFKIKTDIIFSSMDQPLGNYAGLFCEIQEAIKTLSNDGPSDLKELTLMLGAKILIQAGKAQNLDEGIKLQEQVLSNGSALKRFDKLVKLQKGTIDNYTEINRPRYQKFIFTDKSGIINKFNTEKIGWALVELGCGYKYTDSILDYTAGIQFINKIGKSVINGEKLFRVFNSDKKRLEQACLLLKNSCYIEDKVPDFKLILDKY